MAFELLLGDEQQHRGYSEVGPSEYLVENHLKTHKRIFSVEENTAINAHSETDWETGIDIYTLLYVKWITNKN